MVIIARGDDVRYFVIRPWISILAGSLIAVLAVVYLSATAYLVLRDDLIGSTVARQARQQQEYEDRISALRAQMDRINSKQLLDQQTMRRQISELMERQERLKQRDEKLGAVLERADGMKLSNTSIPVPTPRPSDQARLGGEIRPDHSIITGTAYAQAAGSSVPWPLGAGDSGAQQADSELFAMIDRSLRAFEAEQDARIERLAEQAYQTAEAITQALDSAGIPLVNGNMGGPLLPADDPASFEEQVQELDEALDRLEDLRLTVRRVPIANPMPGAPLTSRFGMRTDPFLRRPAHHSGIDFRAGSGAPVSSSAAGKVVKAGWNGGYGRMVEVDHGNGITTRYAHLSRVLVKRGDRVVHGTVVGNVGSSGRSTGPHLHYEIRRKGKALDPLNFISVGRRISEYL